MILMLRSVGPSSDRCSTSGIRRRPCFLGDDEVTPQKLAFMNNKVSPHETMAFPMLLAVLNWTLVEEVWLCCVSRLGREMLFQVFPDQNNVTNFEVGEVRSRDLASSVTQAAKEGVAGCFRFFLDTWMVVSMPGQCLEASHLLGTSNILSTKGHGWRCQIYTIKPRG